jgi:hypothetical protein
MQVASTSTQDNDSTDLTCGKLRGWRTRTSKEPQTVLRLSMRACWLVSAESQIVVQQLARNLVSSPVGVYVSMHAVVKVCWLFFGRYVTHVHVVKAATAVEYCCVVGQIAEAEAVRLSL